MKHHWRVSALPIAVVIWATLLAHAQIASGIPVNAESADGIAAVYVGGVNGIPGNEMFFVLCTTGEVWVAGTAGVGPPNWEQNPPYLRVTFPVSTIADWTPYYLMRTDGSRWYHQDTWGDWLPFPAPCQPVVGAGAESMGSVKRAFK